MAEYAYGETEICNLALDRIGAKRIGSIDSTTAPQAEKCRLHYYHIRNVLQRAHKWRFNADRAKLAQDASWDTDNSDQQFEWDYRYTLPSDFIALRSIYSSSGDRRDRATYSTAIEGNYLYSNDSSCYIRYSKKVTDPAKFDPLFIEVLKLKLAIELYYGIAGSGPVGVLERLHEELKNTMRQVRAMDRQEQNLIGRDAASRWLDARNVSQTGRILEGLM